jgi:hypothetical protein
LKNAGIESVMPLVPFTTQLPKGEQPGADQRPGADPGLPVPVHAQDHLGRREHGRAARVHHPGAGHAVGDEQRHLDFRRPAAEVDVRVHVPESGHDEPISTIERADARRQARLRGGPHVNNAIGLDEDRPVGDHCPPFDVDHADIRDREVGVDRRRAL